MLCATLVSNVTSGAVSTWTARFMVPGRPVVAGGVLLVPIERDRIVPTSDFGLIETRLIVTEPEAWLRSDVPAIVRSASEFELRPSGYRMRTSRARASTRNAI